MNIRTQSFRARLLASARIAPIAMLGGLALGAYPLTAVHAEDAKVEDVIVSGNGAGDPNRLTRQETRVLLNTPRSGGIVNGEKAQEEHLERLQDFTQLVPNYSPNIGNPRTSKPAIRGVGAGAGTGDGSESDTGFIVDNVFYKHVGFQWADFVDLQSFEVALGPQGTAGGKNTTVGNVVINTQLPSFERKASFETSFANYSHVIEKLNVTGPIIDDKLAYRVAFYLDKGDGWLHDAVTGANLLNNDRWGARGQLLYVGDEITDRLIFNYGASHETNNSTTGIFGNSFLLYANGTIAATYAATLSSRLHWPLLSIDPYTQLNTATGTLDERQQGVSNELKWQIGENTLQSITAWAEYTLHPRNSQGSEETAISDSHVNTYVDQYSQEFRLSSPKDQKLEWVTGVFAFYDDIHSYQQYIYGPQATQWFAAAGTPAPLLNPMLMNGTNYNESGKERTFNIAGYGQATYHVDEQLALTLGLRNGYEVKEGSDFGWVGDMNRAFTIQQVLNAFAGANGKATFFDTGGESKSRNMLTGIFNPSYKYNDNITFYTLVGRGEKASAVNTNALPIFNSTNQFQGFQPVLTKAEYNWDYEIGAKTNWLDNHLIISSNFYWTDIFNFQANIADSSFTNANGTPLSSTYLGSVPHVRLRGWEFAGRYTPIENLWLTFNGAYTDARYIDYPDAPPPNDWLWTTNVATPLGAVSHPLTLSLSNTRFTGLPKWSFNVGTNYERPIGKALSELGGYWGDQSYVAFGYSNLAFWDKTQFTNPWSLIQYWQPAYTIVNAGVGLRTEDKRYTIELWVKNLFDQRYIQPNGTWSQGTATAPASYTLQAQPRYFGATFRVQL
jgi:iron complex outermembrane receptor protein